MNRRLVKYIHYKILWYDFINYRIFFLLQDVVYALAHATGKTGRFTLIERWRNNERLLAPQDHPVTVSISNIIKIFKWLFNVILRY